MGCVNSTGIKRENDVLQQTNPPVNKKTVHEKKEAPEMEQIKEEKTPKKVSPPKDEKRKAEIKEKVSKIEEDKNADKENPVEQKQTPPQPKEEKPVLKENKSMKNVKMDEKVMEKKGTQDKTINEIKSQVYDDIMNQAIQEVDNNPDLSLI